MGMGEGGEGGGRSERGAAVGSAEQVVGCR